MVPVVLVGVPVLLLCWLVRAFLPLGEWPLLLLLWALLRPVALRLVAGCLLVRVRGVGWGMALFPTSLELLLTPACLPLI